MFRTTLKSLAARKLRLFTTSFAVMLGVAFMAGTLVLTDTIGKTFDKLFADANKGTDAFVRAEAAFDSEWFGDQRPRLDTSLVDEINEVDGVRGRGNHQGLRPDRRQGRQADGQSQHGCTRRRCGPGSPTTTSTRSISRPGGPHRPTTRSSSTRAVPTRVTSLLGDTMTVLTQAGPQTVTIVGIATFGDTDSPGGASFTLFTPTAAQTYLTHPGKIDAIRIVADPGVRRPSSSSESPRSFPQGPKC